MTEFQRVPVTKPFVAGRGRPDLERLHEVVFSIDRVFDDLEDFPLLLEIRNNVAQYINHRPEDPSLPLTLYISEGCEAEVEAMDEIDQDAGYEHTWVAIDENGNDVQIRLAKGTDEHPSGAY